MNHNDNTTKRLAALGHGKWKRALRHTFIIIGMLTLGAGSMSAWAQEPTPPPDGLHMSKEWYPTNEDGTEGYLLLQTFVTGESMTLTQEISVPTDIAIVVDQSNSMTAPFGSTTRLAALKTAVSNFLTQIYQDDVDKHVAETYGTGHRVAIIGFGGREPSYTGTELLTPSAVNYSQLTNNTQTAKDRYKAALLKVNNRTGEENQYNQTLTTAANSIAAKGATYMKFGLEMAKGVMDNRDGATYMDKGVAMTRPFVVVFFTDGSPGGTDKDNYFTQTTAASDVGNNQTEADAAVAEAKKLKQANATIFTVGVFANADASHPYRTKDPGSSYPKNWHAYSGPAYPCAHNGLMHYISSNYTADEASTWSGLTTQANMGNADYINAHNKGYYLPASDAEGLSQVFTTIASSISQESVSVDLGKETIVQDVISTSFTLPEGAGSNITAYAPRYIGNGTFEESDFEAINDDGVLSLNDDGVVVNGGENKLPSNVISLSPDGKTVQFANFNFKTMWCGLEDDSPHGRRLVLKIPLVVEGGVWGDEIATNGPMSVIFPNGETATPIGPFNTPTANVMGAVWTEIVTAKPDSFNENQDPIEIGTPEDLAWFISYVNGRKGYANEDENNRTPHPGANAILMADIDMSAHNWVAIGAGTTGYAGTFDGNGHVITGLKNNASKHCKMNNTVVVYPGMFSNVKGTVKNVFVLDSDFRARNHADENNHFIHFGIIADTLSTDGQIFNCEAAGRLSVNNDKKTEGQLERDQQIILGGLVGYNNGGIIHSAMAMASLTGYTMGGMIGQNEGSFANGFTNGVYNYLYNNCTKPVGGIAGSNPTGSIANCYVRFSRPSIGLEHASFGQVVGQGSFTAESCYTPQSASQGEVTTTNTAWNATVPVQGASANTYSNTRNPSLIREARSNDNMVGGEWGTAADYSVIIGGTPLFKKLNEGVSDGQATWKRTTAGNYNEASHSGNINGDYPVLAIGDFKCLASSDGVGIDYAKSLDQMLVRHNTGSVNGQTTLDDRYKKTQHAAIYGGAIYLYQNDDAVTESTASASKDGVGTVVYIDENVSLLQDAGSVIEAYTGQTMLSYSAPCSQDPETGMWDETNLYTPERQRWHFVSSSLADSRFGWSYGVESEVGFSWDSNPCEIGLELFDDEHAIFPTDTRAHNPIDFYCFFEPEYHWINFKRNSLSHWHMNSPEEKIHYYHELNGVRDGNETQFIPAKGYLLAIYPQYFDDVHKAADPVNEQFLQNRGTLNNGDITIPVTYTTKNEWSGLTGYNLLGNPYQSYLDFTAFASANSGLWNTRSEMTYAIYDPGSGDYYVQGTAGEQPSEGALAATGDISMHQGFMVRVSNPGTATFTNDMRRNTPATGTHFRGEKANYPLVNLILTDGDGKRDIAVLEVGRPEYGGGQKLRTSSAKGRISLRHDNKDYGILFSEMTEGSQPLYFRAEENGTFTLSWNTANANFTSLTLIDNITGVKYDMLAHDHYEFQGLTTDYKSRFKVVVGHFTGIEEEDSLSAGSGAFAFFDGSQWVINGQGQLEVVDVMGRTLVSQRLTNDQNRVSLNGIANGVYLMRVANGNGVKVQKVVVK